MRVLRGRMRGLRLAATHRPAAGTPHVFYGSRRMPGTGDYAWGGLIKCQYLQQRFPNAPRRFNLLYLVSSLLSWETVPIVRMARRKGVRLVWNQNGVAYPGWHGPGWERLNAPMAALLHEADQVFYQSHFCRMSADRYLGQRRGPSEILYNCVDTRVFTPAAASRDQSLTLLLGGTQAQSYRLESALRALAELLRRGVRATLLVTGRLRWRSHDAHAKQEASRLVTALGLEEHVKFLGPYRQEEAPAIYQRAQILLHTKYNDPCPGVVIEALACGLPVVYSHSGGVPELVGPDAGIGIPAELSWERDIPPDPSALAEGVINITQDWTRYSEAARQRAVERFDVRPWLKRHQETFEALVR